MRRPARAGSRRAGRRRSGGQSVVEFAVIFPLFMVIFAAVISFGVALFNNMTLINAAREGARAGSMTSNVANIPTVVAARVNSAASQAGLGAVATTITCVGMNPTTTANPCTWSRHTSTNTGGAQQGDSVRVRVTYTFANPFPLSIRLPGDVDVGLPATFTLSSTVQMVLDAAESG